MTHYIAPGGAYSAAYAKPKASGFQLHWESAPDGKQGGARAKKAASKTKFTCPECGQNVWAKPDAVLICGDCYEDGFVIWISSTRAGIVPVEYIQRVFAVMHEADWHEYQVLTKRAERLEELNRLLDWAPHIWMGVSVENEKYLERIDHLRRTSAHVKFLSIEPLLGPLGRINLREID